MTQQCKDCDNIVLLENRGNGKCSHCHGHRTKNTILNDISGADTKCWKCKGTGICVTCGGSGRVRAESTVSAPKSAPRPSAPIPVPNLERSWYRLCNSSDFISQADVEYYTAQLSATRNHAAIAVGLSDFAAETCPTCSASGQFKIRFLGRLQHSPGCKSFYLGPGAYMVFQLGQVFHSGVQAGGGMKDDADRNGDRTGGIVNAIFGFLFVAVFRAALAVLLIPIQAVVSLSHSKPATPANVTPASAPSPESGRSSRQ